MLPTTSPGVAGLQSKTLMPPVPSRRFLAFKRSLLKGRYPRIIEVGPSGIRSLDPSKGCAVTNDWKWDGILNCEPDPEGMTLTCLGKGGMFLAGGPEKHSLEGEAPLMVGAYLSERSFAKPSSDDVLEYEAEKISQSTYKAKRVLVQLKAETFESIDAASRQCRSQYFYSTFSRIGLSANGLYIETNHERVHVFQTIRAKDIIDTIIRKASFLQLAFNRKDYPEKSSIELSTLLGGGPARANVSNRDTFWFSTPCEKITSNLLSPARRNLKVYYAPSIFQETAENDDGTIRIVSSRFITAIDCMVCPADQPTRIILHFKDRTWREYRTVNRDVLACCLLDVAGLEPRLSPQLFTSITAVKFRYASDTSQEHSLIAFQALLTTIRLLNSQRADSALLVRAYAEFNVNSAFDGFAGTVPVERTELQIVTVAFANELLDRPRIPQRAVCEVVTALSRIMWFSTPVNTAEFVRLGSSCLCKGDDLVIRAWLHVLHSVLSVQHQERITAYTNRQAFLSPASLSNLETVYSLSLAGDAPERGPMVLTALISLVFEPMLVSERDNTPPEVYEGIVRILLKYPKQTIRLLDLSNCLPGFAQNVALIFARLFEDEGEIRSVEASMEQDASRSENFKADIFKDRKSLADEALISGYFLEVFRNALFGSSRVKRATSRLLVSLFCLESTDVMARLVPPGLMHALEVPALDQAALHAMIDEDQMEDNGFRERARRAEMVQRCGTAPRKKRTLKANFPVFFHMIQKDHSLPDLLWNETTRNELKLALDRELSELSFTDQVSWNFSEFVVEYPSLANEMLLGDCYVRLLLDEDEHSAQKLVKQIRDPLHFFHSLFHHLLRARSDDQRIECLRALKLVSSVHSHTFSLQVGPNGLQETITIVDLIMQSRYRTISEHAFMLLRSLCDDPNNVKLLLRSSHAGKLAIELALLFLARVHSKRVDEHPTKEWFYKDEGGEEIRRGPFYMSELREMHENNTLDIYKVKFWATGMPREWHSVEDLSQLRYELVMTGPAAFDAEAMALAALGLLQSFALATPPVDAEGRWVRPAPKALRLMASKDNISRIANALCATMAPRVVEGAANILALIGRVPELVNKLYLTGAFYFALGYPGSNFDGISRFVFQTHLYQHFTEEAVGSEHSSLKRRSVLGDMLPEAMLYVLQESDEKFKHAFTGTDSDNPELIWTGSMRRSLISAIEAHLQGFCIRLSENSYARFDFVPIPPVTYERLERETFCARYYLGTLSDRDRFPDWPIDDPVALFKATLDTWRQENAKITSENVAYMSKADAYTCLEIESETTDDGEPREVSLDEVKHAFRKLARQYHPDRNPNGRERFEQVHAAYEMLVAPRAEYAFQHILDPVTLASVIDTQILVLERFPEVMQEFRYPGYGLLLDLLEDLLAKHRSNTMNSEQQRLCEAATLLLYRTCWVSHHNAVELEPQVSRLSHFVSGLRNLAQCLSNLLRVIAGMASLSKDVCLKLATESELVEILQSIACDHTEALKHPDCVASVLKITQTTIGEVLLDNAEFAKSLVRWMLFFDSTWKPSENDPYYLESMTGAPLGGVKCALARLAYEASTKHSSRFTRILPEHIVRAMSQFRPLEFLPNFVLGSFEMLTVVWTRRNIVELEAYLDSPDDQTASYPSVDKELIVGRRFFVRMYVEHKAPSEAEFASAVVDFIASLSPADANEQHLSMALEALKLLIATTDDIVESELVKSLTSNVLSKLIVDLKREDLVSGFIDRYPNKAMSSFLPFLENDQEYGAWLSSNMWDSIAKTTSGAEVLLKRQHLLFELLSRTVLSRDVVALTAISRCAWEPTARERLFAVLNQWLPRGLCELSTNPDAMLKTLFSPINIETCRLIWTNETRQELIEFMQRGYHDGAKAIYSSLSSEMEYGGVYLRIFLRDPNQDIDRMETFMDKLMEALLSECTLRIARAAAAPNSMESRLVAAREDDPVLTPVCSAIVALMISKPMICSHVSVWGHIRPLVQVLSRVSHVLSHECASVLRVLRAMCSDQRCLRVFGDTGGVGGSGDDLASILIKVTTSCLDLSTEHREEADNVATLAMEILRQCLDSSDQDAARSVALQLMSEESTDPLAIDLARIIKRARSEAKFRVHAVESLRRLETRFGTPELSSRLVEEFPEWAKMRTQRHDLFLSGQDERANQVFLLKGPAEAVKDVLLLTARPANRNSGEEATEGNGSQKNRRGSQAGTEFDDMDEPPL